MSFTEVTDGFGVNLSSTPSTTNNLHALGPNALALDQQTHPGDTDYQILPTDRYVSTDVALTSPWTWRLPAANSVSRGWQVTVADAFGVCSLTYPITVAPAGADTIRSTTAAKILNSPFSYVKVRSDGVNNWTVVDQFPMSGTPVGDRAYTILSTDTYVYSTETFTAQRTWLLPAASSVVTGWQIVVSDIAGGVNGTFAIDVVPLGSDTVQGSRGALLITVPYGFASFVSDGVSNWQVTAESQTGATGWIAETVAWTSTSATSFTVPRDATAYLTKGTKLKATPTSVQYGHVASSSFAAGVTTVTLITNADYSFNGGLAQPFYSYADNPQGFPTWFNWSPTLAGWSANPTNTVYQYRCDGTAIQLAIRQLTNGTSNNVTHTATLPVTAATLTNALWANSAFAVDNGTSQVGYVSVASAGTTATLNGIFATSTNTNAGNSRIGFCQLTYQF